MGFPRLLKTGASLVSGQGILIATQLLLPPLFLRHYGTQSYGEWLTLSAAANYLGTLNFGLHNFANNHVTIAFNRGDMDEVNAVQATAFAMVSCLAVVAALLASILFTFPVSQWLHLSISSRQANMTMYLLGLQILLRLIFGFLQTAFLVVGSYHRGNNWLNFLQTLSLITTATLVLKHSSFILIAACQLAVTLLCFLFVAIDLYRTAPVAFPRLQYIDRSRIMDILKPSGYYGMLFSANFLVYQLPLVIMQRMLGSTAVVVFSITRTIYSMSRQALTSVSSALGPEITELFGRNDWKRLFRLYDLSERAVFALVPVVALSTFLSTPALLIIWLSKPELFKLNVCVLMTLISAASGVKEHKYQFQISINHHAEMARFQFFTYLAMVACMLPIVFWFGIGGFLVLWLITEIIQIWYTVRLNQLLFRHFSVLEMQPLVKVAVITALGLAICVQLSNFVLHWPAIFQLLLTLLFAGVLLTVEYPIFRLDGLKEVWLTRRRGSPVVTAELTSLL